MPEKSSLPGATLGLIGGSAAAAGVTFLASSSVEKAKFSYAIIQQSLEADTLEERVSRLQFLIDMGFVSDDALRGKLEERIKSSAITPPQSLPQLPAAAGPQGPGLMGLPTVWPFAMAGPDKDTERTELVAKLKSLGFRAIGRVFRDPAVVTKLGEKVVISYFFEEDAARTRLLEETLGWVTPGLPSVAVFVPGVTDRTPGYVEMWLGS